MDIKKMIIVKGKENKEIQIFPTKWNKGEGWDTKGYFTIACKEKSYTWCHRNSLIKAIECAENWDEKKH